MKPLSRGTIVTPFVLAKIRYQDDESTRKKILLEASPLSPTTAPSSPFRCLASSRLSSFCGTDSFGKRRSRVCSVVLLHLFIQPRSSQRCRFVRQDVRSLLSSPRLDTSRRPRIVLEITAFSRYFPGLRSGEFRVYPSRLILSPTISPSRLRPRTDQNLVRRRVVSDKLCKLPLTFDRILG